MKPTKPKGNRPPDPAQRLYPALLFFAASLLTTALIVVDNNSTRSFGVFAFLLFFGCGIMLGLGVTRGVLVGLLMVAIWIYLKRLLGVWEEVRLLDLLLELILVSLTFILAGRYHDRLQTVLNVYQEHQNQLKQLDLEDRTVGLLRSSIGMLRLNEEEERSIRYRRPFAVILIMALPIKGSHWEPNERAELMRAIATSIKDTIRETDIPFLARDHQIAVILPETDTAGANRVVNNILNRMITTQFVTPFGTSIALQTRAQLRYGFAVFLGHSLTQINLMEAAEKSLRRSLEINNEDMFQNLFIEWETVGDLAIPTPLFEKAIS